MDSDNSWSNILYILAIAGFGLIKYLFKNKPRKESTSSPLGGGEKEGKKSVLETFFGELFQVDEPIVHEEEFIPEEESDFEKVVKKASFERKDVRPNLVMEIEEFDSEDSFGDDNSSLEVEYFDADEFDLKKAVIYSELINRKYI